VDRNDEVCISHIHGVPRVKASINGFELSDQLVSKAEGAYLMLANQGPLAYVNCSVIQALQWSWDLDCGMGSRGRGHALSRHGNLIYLLKANLGKTLFQN